MSEPTPLWSLYAWRHGEEWRYCHEPAIAPPDAVEVRGYLMGGQLVLHHRAGGGGDYIWGATSVDDGR